MASHVPQVGAPDPERNTSPILDEDEEFDTDRGLETGVCYFNDVEYALGDYVRSGSELLRCMDPGVWVRQPELPDE